MPKNKRGKRKTKKWRSIDTGLEANAALKVEKELVDAKGKKFFVDKSSGETQEFTSSQRKEIARAKVLTVEKLCNPFPNINPSIPPQQKRKRSTSMKAEGGSKRQKLSTESATTHNNAARRKQQGCSQFYDMWAPPEDPTKKFTEQFPDVEAAYFEPPHTIPRPVRKTPSTLPAIAPPHPGTSYNPALDAYLVLLNMAVQEQIKKRIKLNRVIKALRGLKLPNAVKEADDIADLANKTEEEKAQEEADEAEQEPDIPKVYQAHIFRKTRTERNTMARKKRNRVGLLLKMKEEERQEKLEHLEEIVKELQERENRIREKIKRTEEKKKHQSEETLRLGKEKYTDPEIDVLLPDQLPERLAHYSTYKNEINPILDRIASIQKRNIIEYRSKKLVYRKKPNYVAKFCYKEFSRQQEDKYKDLK